jgi:ABC-type polysaccharide/polyol phosphate export permease
MRDRQRTVPIRVYGSGRRSGGLLSTFLLAAREVNSSRYVIWRLFTRDFVTQFRQKLLGYLWAVVGPFLGIASFVFMNYAGVFNPGKTDVPYPLYILFGTTFWGILIGTTETVSSGLLNRADLVLRTSIPRISLAIAGLAGIIYGQIINLIVLTAVLVLFRVVPSPWALLYPVLLLPLVIMGVGIGLVLAVIGVVARDLTGMTITFLGLVMYLTPVAYVADFKQPIVKALVWYNPLTYLIEAPRNIFFSGGSEHLTGFLISVGFAVVVLMIGVHVFYLTKDKVAERL